MKIVDLLNHWNSSLPSAKDLTKIEEFTLGEAEDYLDLFRIPLKTSLLPSHNLKIQHLNEYYNLEGKRFFRVISIITSPWIHKKAGLVFGSIDSEFLVLDSQGEIFIADDYDFSPIFKCAKSEESFCDALFVCISIFQKLIRHENILENERTEILRRAAIAAGGNIYFDFYDAYLG